MKNTHKEYERTLLYNLDCHYREHERLIKELIKRIEKLEGIE